MSSSAAPANPKLHSVSGTGRSHWYPYYAGYSPDFVADLISHLQLDSKSTVLDPWNGSGTTTSICSIKGVPSIGFDINPSMVVVSRARLVAAHTSASLEPLLQKILAVSKAMRRPKLASDPLCSWYTLTTAGRLRSVESAIRSILVGGDTSSVVDVSNLSSLAAFYYVLLFRVTRRLAGKSTTNPTWIKVNAEDNRVSLTWEQIEFALSVELNDIGFYDDGSTEDGLQASAIVKVGDSRAQSLKDSSVDAVITSPPYCTRIDYAVATRVELAVLNYSNGSDFESLRRSMLGTTLSEAHSGQSEFRLGSFVSTLLEAIKKHPSKASAGYYYLTYNDYFNKLRRSICELGRVIRKGGSATFVVQDSHYKELHVDLALVVEQLFQDCGFRLEMKWDYPVLRSLRQINSGSRSHSGKWLPTESVLILRK